MNSFHEWNRTFAEDKKFKWKMVFIHQEIKLWNQARIWTGTCVKKLNNSILNQIWHYPIYFLVISVHFWSLWVCQTEDVHIPLTLFSRRALLISHPKLWGLVFLRGTAGTTPVSNRRWVYIFTDFVPITVSQGNKHYCIIH